MRLSIPAEVVWKSAAVPPCCDWVVLRSLHPSPTGKSCLPQLRFETELHCAQITRLTHFPGSSAVLAGTDKGSLQAGHAAGKARMDCRKSEASSGELEHAWRTHLQIHGMLFTFSSQLFSLDFPQPLFLGLISTRNTGRSTCPFPTAVSPRAMSCLCTVFPALAFVSQWMAAPLSPLARTGFRSQGIPW